MIKLRSIECPSGQIWDYSGKTEVVQIFISYDDYYINFIQFLYVENGSLVLSESPANCKQGSEFDVVKLDYPAEFITSISGSYSSVNGYRMTSITFVTNKGKSHGPFGHQGELDRVFNFRLGPDRPFGGFHGSTKDGYLESIGVYVKPIATLSNLNSPGEGKKNIFVWYPEAK